MDYLIKGSTFPAKEELKSIGCYWDAAKKFWRIDSIEKDSVTYKRVSFMGFEMVPVELSPDCKKIQDIMDGRK